MLRVKLLEGGARAPVVAHPGEDLGYDLFALEAITLVPRSTVRVRTGIAVEARDPRSDAPLGLLVRDRSSMAARGLATTGGVIDAGYRGEILVVMTNLGDSPVELKAGEKIAQMPLTAAIWPDDSAATSSVDSAAAWAAISAPISVVVRAAAWSVVNAPICVVVRPPTCEVVNAATSAVVRLGI